ncbi:queuosine precursor transporter [Yangia mangrovi]|uniref:Probable queuosine precursor transporter n=1 Tax=Alloyangia mangrovi TaxID=1779329 RepID=A0A2A3JSQ8_9RHOB|nr:queuosine precursor transporter [Alloyangia mangrovi]MCA0941372.1 queuosine precursor transporter [Alloyangia pacifica]MCA0946578.1 queuosine precursor transporter [Alloyangia pacifica]MCT4370323.1 queuosine precursor transporter [Alloyangia mangrovi]
MTRSYLPGILAMAATVLASNILVQILFGQWLTWGAFTYPVAFLVTDLMNRLYGVRAARKVVLAGFVTGVICSLIGTQVMLQGDGYSYPAVTLRVAIGSGAAFLAAQLMDVSIFDKLRDGAWWRAPLASTLVGSSLDTAIFFSVAFAGSLSFLEPGNDVSWANEMLPLLGAGPIVPLWVSLGLADWMVKLSLAILALVPFRMIVSKALSSRAIA